MTLDLAASPPAMRLYVMDARVRDAAPLVDLAALRRILRAAAADARVSVLGEQFHVFDNGAVTGVLLLAQSHLSIHTWPELLLANVDLLTYGEADGEAALRRIAAALHAEQAEISCIERALA